MLRALTLTCMTYGVAALLLMFVAKPTALPLAVAYVVSTLVFIAGARRMIGAELRESVAVIFARIAA